MLKIKKGFSLAELLISLGILSIIATVGFTLTRQGIDRAYDMYLYTGYMGIYNAILDANANGLYISDNGLGNGVFFKHIATALDIDPDTIENLNNAVKINAANKISYTIRYNATFANRPQYSITMDVPAKKTRAGNSLSTCLGYLPKNNLGILLPTAPAICTDIGANSINLMNRIDLLPFYIDTGLTGRTRPVDGFVPREYYSAEEAVCSTTTSNVTIRSSSGISFMYMCAGRGLTQVVGAIKPAHPRKIR